MGKLQLFKQQVLHYQKNGEIHIAVRCPGCSRLLETGTYNPEVGIMCGNCDTEFLVKKRGSEKLKNEHFIIVLFAKAAEPDPKGTPRSKAELERKLSNFGWYDQKYRLPLVAKTIKLLLNKGWSYTRIAADCYCSRQTIIGYEKAYDAGKKRNLQRSIAGSITSLISEDELYKIREEVMRELEEKLKEEG